MDIVSTEIENVTDRAAHTWELRVMIACALVASAAWLYLLDAPMPMDMGNAWNVRDGALLIVMWAVMMLAMMLPSVTGMLALLANNQRTVNRGHTAFAFSAGYFIVWMVASTSAALLQWMLHNAGVMRDAMHLPVAVAGVLLIIAGVYQFLPLKDRCLARCRNPLSFLMSSWRDGTSGAVRMGIDYGVVCLGCCGALMVVLFAVGVMDLLAVAALAALVALEKMSSFGRQLSRVTGAALVLGGLVTLVVS